MMRPLTLVLLLATAVSTAVLDARTKVKSTWKASEALPADFGGRKIAILTVTADQSLQVSAEEGLAAELRRRGRQVVAAYTMMPREVARDTDQARAWFERAGVGAVIAVRPVSDAMEHTYVPSLYMGPYYGSFWGYYGYAWGAVSTPGYMREDRVVLVETLLFDLAANRLAWAAVVETENPKNREKFLKEFVDACAKELAKQGLVKARG